MLDNASAHADYNDILEWLSHFKRKPKKVFITHGELNASMSLKLKIEELFNWSCVVPSYLYSEDLL
jgi:metallo-beta-lactamase family protein